MFYVCLSLWTIVWYVLWFPCLNLFLFPLIFSFESKNKPFHGVYFEFVETLHKNMLAEEGTVVNNLGIFYSMQISCRLSCFDANNSYKTTNETANRFDFKFKLLRRFWFVDSQDFMWDFYSIKKRTAVRILTNFSFIRNE